MKTTKAAIIIGITTVMTAILLCPTHENSTDIREDCKPVIKNSDTSIKNVSYDDTTIYELDESIPTKGTDWYTYMDLDAITDQNSEQYNRKSRYWLDESGIWCSNNDYVVAMGNGFGKIGERYMITTDRGNRFSVVIGDHKSDIDTDLHNHYSLTYVNGEPKFNVIEFIVDTDTLNEDVKESGNIGDYYFITGNITNIEKIS